MIIRYVRRLLLLSLVAISSTDVDALEYVVTDTLGGYNNPLNTTTNKLNLGDNPVAKTVYVYIKYSQAEANIINDVNGTGTLNPNPGLYGGSMQMTFSAPTIAGVKLSSDITRGPNGTTLNWDTFTPTVPPASASPRVSFNQGLTAPYLSVTDPGAGNFGYYVISQVVISPGTSINSSGTNVQVSKNLPTGASWTAVDKENNIIQLGAPTVFNFTVVPEASTWAMGVVSFVTMLSALHRRRMLNSSKFAG